MSSVTDRWFKILPPEGDGSEALLLLTRQGDSWFLSLCTRSRTDFEFELSDQEFAERLFDEADTADNIVKWFTRITERVEAEVHEPKIAMPSPTILTPGSPSSH